MLLRSCWGWKPPIRELRLKAPFHAKAKPQSGQKLWETGTLTLRPSAIRKHWFKLITRPIAWTSAIVIWSIMRMSWSRFGMEAPAEPERQSDMLINRGSPLSPSTPERFALNSNKGGSTARASAETLFGYQQRLFSYSWLSDISSALPFQNKNW